ncbi:LysR family transcriptional regulator, partial [Vibrio owensii]
MLKDLYSNLDLNLLRTFLVIYQEQNLQKASNRL